MSERGLRRLVQGFLEDSYAFGLQLPVPEDIRWYNPLPKRSHKKLTITNYGAQNGAIHRTRNAILGSPAFAIQNGRITTEIARLPPYHPDIGPQAVFYQIGKDGTVVSVSPGRSFRANIIDRLIIGFQTLTMQDGVLHTSKDSSIAICTSGDIDITETNLPPAFGKPKLRQFARTVLEHIRDGKPVADLS